MSTALDSLNHKVQRAAVGTMVDVALAHVNRDRQKAIAEMVDVAKQFYGDSFSEYYMPYLEARFATTWREHIDSFDPAVVEQPGCDILILEFNERSLDKLLTILGSF